MGLFDGTPLERPVTCDQCQQDVKECTCEPREQKEDSGSKEVEPNRQSLSVRVDKRKGGKLITVISNIRGSQQQLEQWLTDLKNACGSGGNLSDEMNIELQGDHLHRLEPILLQMGFRKVRLQGKK